MLSKAVTEAGHFGLLLLLAALKRASDSIMKMMLDRRGTLEWVLLNLSGQWTGTAAGISHCWRTQQQATSRTGLLEGRTAHSLQIVNRETCLDNSSSLPKPNVQPLGPEEHTQIFLNCNMIIKVTYQISKILIV